MDEGCRADGRLGAIEGGGTKFVVAVGDETGAVSARHALETTTPEDTLSTVAAWLRSHGPLRALGVGMFGPIEVDRNASKWGRVLETPKPGWSGFDVAGFLTDALAVPIAFGTDVNAAATGEYRLGAGAGRSSLAYLTVGTGIGGGFVIDGTPLHGSAHPEVGHIFVPRQASDGTFAGSCPFHGDCLEGLASGTAIMARWGKPLSALAPNHPAHAVIAGYLAQTCHTVFAVTGVETIVLGGGVMNTPGLLDRVRRETARIGGDYLPGRKSQRIVRPGLGGNSAIVGALCMAGELSRAGPR